jgi:hypothetical protein
MQPEILLKRTHLLQQMAALQTMETGSLKEEYHHNQSGGKAGPYYKHQAWKDGANLSRRVPAEQAVALREAIANRQKFEALAAEFIEVTVALTRQTPAAAAQKKTTPSTHLRRKKRSPAS